MKGSYMVAYGMAMMDGMQAEHESRKKEILSQWEATKKMPRKLKKRRRKELLIDWSLIMWSEENSMF